MRKLISILVATVFALSSALPLRHRIPVPRPMEKKDEMKKGDKKKDSKKEEQQETAKKAEPRRTR